MSFFKKLFSKQPPPAESDYDYPGEYANRFDGVEPQAPQGGDSSTHDGAPEDLAAPEAGGGSHPDFVWLPTINPTSEDQPGIDVAARFSLGGSDLASFSELQGINSEVDVVDYMDSEDEAVLGGSGDLGSWAKVAGLPVDAPPPDPAGDEVATPEDEAEDDRFNGQYLVQGAGHRYDEPGQDLEPGLTGGPDPAEAPDDNASTWIRVQQQPTGGSAAPPDTAPHELAHVVQQGSRGSEGGINDMLHQRPTPDPAPDDLASTDSGPEQGTFQSVGGLKVEHEVVEYEDDDDEHGSTLLRLTSDSDLPDPTDVREAEPGDENELEDLIDLL